MLVRWTQPAADDLLHICDYTPQNVSARRRPAVWQTRSMKPPPRCKTCRTVDEKAASPTRGKCLSPASRSSLFTASDKKRLRSPVSCILRSNGLNHHEGAKDPLRNVAIRPFDIALSAPVESIQKKIPFSNMIKLIIGFKGVRRRRYEDTKQADGRGRN
jgi:hypothetical protein